MQGDGQAAQSADHGFDLLFTHAGSGGALAQAHLVPGALGFGLGDPSGDRDRAGPGVQRGAILDEFVITRRDLLNCSPVIVRADSALVLRCDKIGDGLAEAVRGELAGEPAVDVGEDRVFAQADIQRVGDPVGQGVLDGGTGSGSTARCWPSGSACAARRCRTIGTRAARTDVAPGAACARCARRPGRPGAPEPDRRPRDR